MSSSAPRTRALIVALAALGVSVVGAGTASAASLSANIGYTTHASRLACDDPATPAGTPPCHIAVINTDGAGREITTGAADNDLDPAWSPDGTKIAFARNTGGGGYDIWTMNADGSNRARLTTDPRDERYPTWSPDGTQLAYRGPFGAANATRIFVIGSAGGPARALTGTSGADQPAWSPDGSRIAFTANVAPTGATPDDEIFVVAIAGGTPRNLTNSAATSDRYPAWYPSGNRIAFRRFNPPPAAPSPRQLFTIDCADATCSSGTPKITDLSPQLGDGRAASWSPDAKYLTYVGYPNPDRDAEIYVGSLDGTTLRPRQITNNDFTDDEPRWANVPVANSPVPVSSGGATPSGSSAPTTTKPAGSTVTVGGGLVNGRRALGLSLLIPKQTLRRHKSLRAYVRCNRTCTVTGGAKAKVRTGKKAKSLQLFKVRKKARASRRTRVTLRIPSKTLRAVRSTLKRKRKVVITLSLSARTAAGEFTPAATSRLTLRR